MHIPGCLNNAEEVFLFGPGIKESKGDLDLDLHAITD